VRIACAFLILLLGLAACSVSDESLDKYSDSPDSFASRTVAQQLQSRDLIAISRRLSDNRTFQPPQLLEQLASLFPTSPPSRVVPLKWKGFQTSGSDVHRMTLIEAELEFSGEKKIMVMTLSFEGPPEAFRIRSIVLYSSRIAANESRPIAAF